MNAELEALLKALSALQEARGEEATRARKAQYNSRLDESARRLGISKQALKIAVQDRFWQWIKAQQKTSTIPPKA
jgi:hypothetical protein